MSQCRLFSYEVACSCRCGGRQQQRSMLTINRAVPQISANASYNVACWRMSQSACAWCNGTMPLLSGWFRYHVRSSSSENPPNRQTASTALATRGAGITLRNTAKPSRVPIAKVSHIGYTGPTGSKQRALRSGVNQEAGTVEFTATRALGPREGLTIVVGFPTHESDRLIVAV